MLALSSDQPRTCCPKRGRAVGESCGAKHGNADRLLGGQLVAGDAEYPGLVACREPEGLVLPLGPSLVGQLDLVRMGGEGGEGGGWLRARPLPSTIRIVREACSIHCRCRKLKAGGLTRDMRITLSAALQTPTW